MRSPECQSPKGADIWSGNLLEVVDIEGVARVPHPYIWGVLEGSGKLECPLESVS